MIDSAPNLQKSNESASGRAPVGFALRLSQYALLFISSIIVAHALKPAGRAAYILPLTVAGISAIFTQLSLDQAVGRALAAREVPTLVLVRSALAAALLLGALGSLVAGAACILLRDGFLHASNSIALVAASASVVPTVVAGVAAGTLVCLGGFQQYGLVSAVAGSAQLGSVGLLAATRNLGVTSALLATVGSTMLLALGMIVSLGAKAGWSSLIPIPRPRLLGALIASGAGFHLATLTLALNVRMDLLVVGALSTAHATGLYSLSVTLTDAAGFAAVSLAQSVVHIQVTDSARAAAFTVDFARRSLLAAGIVAGVALPFLYPFVLLAYGPEWAGATLPCVLLLISVVIATPELPIRSIIVLLGGRRQLLRVAAATLLVNLGLDFALIPILGLVGASLASVASASVFTWLTLRVFTSVTGLPATGVFALPRIADRTIAASLHEVRVIGGRLIRRVTRR